MSSLNLWCLRCSQMTSSGRERDIMNIKQEKAEKLKYCDASVNYKTREREKERFWPPITYFFIYLFVSVHSFVKTFLLKNLNQI